MQAGERTSHLFRLANRHGALVLGTGDLSELALGWSTYGVGDHMSHYNVNASVPKTLIQFLLRWAIETDQFGQAADAVLDLDPRHRDLAGADPDRSDPDADVPDQHSEQIVGPYELVDFFLYYALRFGYRPSKVAWMAHHAWGDRDRGRWPDLIPPERRNEYSLAEIVRWLEVFLTRFFSTSQFKRSAIPNAPEGRLRRIALPARGLARAVGRQRGRLARGAARRGPDRMTTMSAGGDPLLDAAREKMRGADQTEEAIRSFLSAASSGFAAASRR